MSKDCALCTYHAYEQAIIYQDDQFILAAHPFPTTEGELILYPKQHYTILEELPPPLVERFFQLAAQAAVLVYETFKPAGTSILLQNGSSAGQFIPHVSMSIIPRHENDQLPLAWQGMRLPAERLQLLHQQISSMIKHIREAEAAHQQPSPTPSSPSSQSSTPSPPQTHPPTPHAERPSSQKEKPPEKKRGFDFALENWLKRHRIP